MTVFSGRDVDLGRRVALMVLDEDQAENPEVVKRFVEEARITLLTTMSAPGFELPLPSWLVFRRDFAALRDGGEALSRLPAPEQAAWRELMTELDALLPPPPKPAKEPR